MSVELPFAPVDSIIRAQAGDLRVSADATEELAQRIQSHGAEVAISAAEQAATDNRKTLMADDFGVEQVVSRREVTLPIAPIDRIARLEIDSQYSVSIDTRTRLAAIL